MNAVSKPVVGMAAIEWTDRTWNPWVGCSYHHEGCRHCYAGTGMAPRLQGANEGGGAGKLIGTRPQYEGVTSQNVVLPDGSVAKRHFNGRVNRSPDHIFNLPLTVRKPTVWFVNSMSDVGHENVKDEWLVDLWTIMTTTPHHSYQILTKRPKRLADAIHRLKLEMTDNIWIGASISQDKLAKPMVRDLLRCGAKIHFVSAEPLIEALPSLEVEKLDWVIAGGESGIARTVRLTDPDWVRDLRDRCEAAGTAFFFKQWGAYDQDGVRGSKKDNGHLLDGKEIWQMPAHVWDSMRNPNPRWAKVHKVTSDRLRNKSAALRPQQRALLRAADYVVLDPIDFEKKGNPREAGTIMLTDDEDEVFLQKVSANRSPEDQAFANPNYDPKGHYGRVRRVLIDQPQTVDEITRKVNLSRPSVVVILRKLVQMGQAFQNAPIDGMHGLVKVAYSRQSDADQKLARAELLMSQATALLATIKQT